MGKPKHVDDEALREALAILADRQDALDGELCPRCARREVAPRSDRGWCGVCDAEKDVEEHETAKARKRRYWHKKGKHKRKEAE